MKRIKIKDDCPVGSIRNAAGFSIEKGQIKIVPDDFRIDSEVFEELTEDMESQTLDDLQAKNFLYGPESEIKRKLKISGLKTEDLRLLEKLEIAGKKRTNIIREIRNLLPRITESKPEVKTVIESGEIEDLKKILSKSVQEIEKELNKKTQGEISSLYAAEKEGRKRKTLLEKIKAKLK